MSPAKTLALDGSATVRLQHTRQSISWLFKIMVNEIVGSRAYEDAVKVKWR